MLPDFGSLAFWGLVAAAVGGPYLLTLSMYVYHFTFRKTNPTLRSGSDMPIKAHSEDWQNSIVRPEGISAVVGYYMLMGLVVTYGLGIDVIPPAMHRLDTFPNPLTVMLYFLVFDSLMWCIHWCQHAFPLLYKHTHSVHHKIKSPSILVALTGYLPDTVLLIIVPLHATLFLVPNGSFPSIFIFSAVSLLHLHLIHSEFVHAWDPWFRKIGLVSTYDHHVHHIAPRKNLAHFFTALDRVMGTYLDPDSVPKLASTLSAHHH